jgi:hypothetical protein
MVPPDVEGGDVVSVADVTADEAPPRTGSAPPPAGADPAPETPDRPAGTAVETDVEVVGVVAARVAGVVAVARTAEVFEAGGISRRDVIAEFASARFAPLLAERTSRQVVDLLFGLRREAGGPVDVRLLSQPVTATATSTGPGSVAVEVWTVSVFVAEGVSPAPEQWSTIRLGMVWEDGRWLVDSWEMSLGPSPVPAPDGGFASGDEVGDVLAWTPVGVSGGVS